MKNRILFSLFGLITISIPAFSQTDYSTAATDSLTATEAIAAPKEYDPDEETRNEKLYWDAYLRVRHEFWDNQEDLNDDLDDLFSFFRFKAFLGGGINLNKNIKIYGRLVNESRLYGHKGTGDSLRNDHFYRLQRQYVEFIIGQLYISWANIANLPLHLTIGRQNLHNKGFGNQWLIGDGTPVDGSKTFYYNAIRLTYVFNKKSSIDLVGLVNHTYDPMVIYSEVDKTLTNITDEQGGWLWLKHHLGANFPLDAFYLFKHENGGGGLHREEESNIHTLGLHLKPESEQFWLDAQLAVQTGNYGDNSRSGIGTIIYGGYQIKTKNWLTRFGPWYMYLTGDDPSTEKFEAFNNLFGGYPNDDELYLNTWARESGLSMWTNINLPGAYFQVEMPAKFNIRFWYHYMKANHLVEGDFFGNGKFRGHMIMLKAMGEFGKRLKAYYMFQYLWPGDFYFNSADGALLNRVNLEWHF